MDVDQCKSVLNVEHLRQKIDSEYHFISSVLDRVPSLYWQGKCDSAGYDMFLELLFISTVSSTTGLVT